MFYEVDDGYLDLTVNWVLDRESLQPLRHAGAREITRAVHECRRGWNEYTTNDGATSSTTTEDALVHPSKAYKNVPGLESLKKQYKLERKLNILTYKINHKIATDEDLDLYETILEGGVTLDAVSSDDGTELLSQMSIVSDEASLNENSMIM